MVSPQSDVYFVNMGVVNGELAPTLFSSTDATYHNNVRKAMNPSFTPSSMATYQPFVEQTIGVFIKEFDRRFTGKDSPEGSIDLYAWLSFYLFDSISELTHCKRHGFITTG